MSSQTEAITIVAGAGARERELEPAACGPTTPRGKLRSLARRSLREPLSHFLLAGALLFAIGTRFSRDTTASGKQSSIHVSRAEIERLSEVWTRQYGREPDSAQIKNLVDEYIREEILYREAIASEIG